ncbi:hypothetical protein GJ744_010470 [Endocarpon pusillum]|uniref:Uncharacterized protein n=1 Tax=Endocarpon pusillum TaxID=364733 RepID=A0A8H7AHZ4_9EURO|nr:hypothetical protein GJ744_010470 [Endocarpon pusillum]
MMDSPTAYPDSPLDPDEAAYPCKGCGEVLEEGKAFELAGNRWHIDCFRCNTCNTLLDSDANLLLLGDGSLICNNCTYSCSSCNNKIEDLAILTGDQAFCATCFKCRNCKKKIENLRYARTSQGIFCMECHEALMARRRKRTARNAAHRQKAAANNALLDKSLPSLPPSAAPQSSYSPELETPPSDSHSETPTEVPPRLQPRSERRGVPRGLSRERRDASPANSRSYSRDVLNIPHVPTSRHSSMSQRSEVEGLGGEEFLIPVAFDPTVPAQVSPHLANNQTQRTERDYFAATKTAEHVARNSSGGTPTSPLASPHIAYQEKGRVPSEEVIDSIKKRREDSFSTNGPATTSPLVGLSVNRPQYATPSKDPQNNRGMASEERFKLQEVPKAKRLGGSARSSKSGPASQPTMAAPSFQGPSHEPEKTNETCGGDVAVVQEPESFLTQNNGASRQLQDYRPTEDGSTDSLRLAQASMIGQLQYPPKRGDSLERSIVSQSIPRKEVPSTVAKTQEPPEFKQELSSTSATTSMASEDVSASEKVNGANIEEPGLGGIFDTSLSRKGDSSASKVNGSFVAPRVPPSPPIERTQRRNQSFSTSQSETLKVGSRPTSPGLPRWSAGGDFSMDEDMARILGGEDSQGHESFLRRVSNSVRHGRSFSDKGIRVSKEQKWPRSPIANNAMNGQDTSRPTTSSSEHRDELAWVKNELRRERQKTMERDQKIAELETALHSAANIKQVNSELREKRSTIVVLDTRKEMVVRELEVLTEHIAAAKKSGDPLDLSKMNHAVMRDFAESLQRLKDSFAPQIEEFIQKRNDLIDEVSNLTQMKDKSVQEFEQLSLKNAQLAELNNQLVHQIQELYKASSGAQAEQSRGAPNGLGIYSHHKDRSQISIDSREGRSNVNEMSMVSSGTTLQQEEAEPVTVLQGPQVVSIRKGQPKKFNWKNRGQNVAKGVTKGLKGAFSSTQASYSREMQFTETVPYNSTPPTTDYANNATGHGNAEPPRPGFGLFGGNPKLGTKGHQPWKSQSNGSSPALTIDASTTLFGSDLEARAEFEKTLIPFVVRRCIEEVELRGMDIEGIYRKAGGASQVQVIKDGFETSPQQNFDISDPDLDIHAVSSTLKQYFRRLPNPLVTYEVYDKLLETTSISGFDAKIEAMSRALMDLPRVHREVLEFLVFHLKRVVGYEQDNLMTSMNIAVVFAPTIMRPESLAREMTDMQVKNEAVQFLVENCQPIFNGVLR